MEKLKERKHKLSTLKKKTSKIGLRPAREQEKKPHNQMSKREVLSIVMSMALSYLFCTVFLKILMNIVVISAKWSVLPFILMLGVIVIYAITLIIFYKTSRPYTDKVVNELADRYYKRKVKRIGKNKNRKRLG